MVIEWIYNQNQNWDFGFVDVEGKEKWYYVYSFNKKDALDWDTVLAQVRVFKWKEEAIIIKILKRTEKTLVWEYCEWKDKKYRNRKKKAPSFWPDEYNYSKIFDLRLL